MISLRRIRKQAASVTTSLSLRNILLIRTLYPRTEKSARITLKIQEKEVAEAGLLYLEDHCKNPIEDKRCDLENMQINSLDYTYNGYIDLQKLINEKYIEPVEISGVECTGYVQIYDNKSEACLVCGDKYATRNDKVCTRGLR